MGKNVKTSIKYTDFIPQVNGSFYDEDTNSMTLLPFYINGEIKWLPWSEARKVSLETCARCRRVSLLRSDEAVDDDIGLFMEYGEVVYKINVAYPFNLCFDCAKKLLDAAIKNA